MDDDDDLVVEHMMMMIRLGRNELDGERQCCVMMESDDFVVENWKEVLDFCRQWWVVDGGSVLHVTRWNPVIFVLMGPLHHTRSNFVLFASYYFGVFAKGERVVDFSTVLSPTWLAFGGRRPIPSPFERSKSPNELCRHLLNHGSTWLAKYFGKEADPLAR